MKCLLLLICVTFLLLVAVPVRAGMFLVSDPYLTGGWQPSDFVYQIQTGTNPDLTPIWGTDTLSLPETMTAPAGAVRVKMDITTWPLGKITMRWKARKIILPLTVEESDWGAPFSLLRTSGQKIPSGFGLAE